LNFYIVCRCNKDCQNKKVEYEQALKLFEQFEKEISKGFDLLKYWKLSAKNLINRSAAATILLSNEITRRFNVGFKGDLINKATTVLTEMRTLRKETEELYLEMIKPVRVRLIIGWMYNSIEKALEQITK